MHIGAWPKTRTAPFFAQVGIGHDSIADFGLQIADFNAESIGVRCQKIKLRDLGIQEFRN